MRSRRNHANPIIKVRADQLKVHPVAQRRLVPAQVKFLMETFDLDKIGVFAVVEWNGETFIVDGQHRWTALMRHGFGEWVVQCQLYTEAKDDPAEASRIFLALNKRAAINAYDSFANKLAAGDQVAVAVADIVNEAGMSIERTPRDGFLSCVAAMERVYAIDQGATLRRVLHLLHEAWGTTSTAYEAKVVEGVALVASRYNGELKEDILAKKLAKYPGGAAGLIGNAKGLKNVRRQTSIPACVAEVVVETYNTGRRTGRLAW